MHKYISTLLIPTPYKYRYASKYNFNQKNNCTKAYFFTFGTFFCSDACGKNLIQISVSQTMLHGTISFRGTILFAPHWGF